MQCKNLFLIKKKPTPAQKWWLKVVNSGWQHINLYSTFDCIREQPASQVSAVKPWNHLGPWTITYILHFERYRTWTAQSQWPILKWQREKSQQLQCSKDLKDRYRQERKSLQKKTQTTSQTCILQPNILQDLYELSAGKQAREMWKWHLHSFHTLHSSPEDGTGSAIEASVSIYCSVLK